MRLYVWGSAPNPRRVRMFLAEKGISVPMEDVGDGAFLSAEYRGHYPFRMVPMLELDDGTQIGEAMAICCYFEALHPDPPLMGRDAKDRALIEMWERRAYDEGFMGAAEIFRNSNPAFKGRGLPGYAEPVAQISELAGRGQQRLDRFFKMFNDQLTTRPFIVGEHISVADITALCSIDFAKRLAEVSIPVACGHLSRWYDMLSSRPSAQA